MKFKRPYNYHDVIILVCCSIFVVFPYFSVVYDLLIIPSIILMFEALRIYRREKLDMKNSYDYCRVSKTLWSAISATLALFAVLFFSDYLEISLWKSAEMDYYLYLIAVATIVLSLVSAHAAFTSGMRWYLSGIKLPGWRRLLIPWRFVTDVRLEKRTLFVEVDGKRHKMDVHSADLPQAEQFVEFWRKNKA